MTYHHSTVTQARAYPDASPPLCPSFLEEKEPKLSSSSLDLTAEIKKYDYSLNQNFTAHLHILLQNDVLSRCIVGYGAGALWDLYNSMNRSIDMKVAIHVYVNAVLY